MSPALKADLARNLAIGAELSAQDDQRLLWFLLGAFIGTLAALF